MAQTKIDVLAVGNVVSDIFIKLFDNEEKIEKTRQGEWLAIPFGTKVPFDYSEYVPAVGNAPNAAVSFSRLGLKTGLVSNVGDDPEGREILAALHKEKINTHFTKINPGHKSQVHFVLWYKEERTILVRDQIQFAYKWPHFHDDEIPHWLYFSSVGKSNVEYDEQIADWLAEHEEVKLALQPGTFQIQTGAKKLKKLYEQTDVLALNREEAVLVSGGKHDDIHDLLDRLHALGPKIVVISDGHAGAYASDGNEAYKMPIYPDPKPPFERTGAGDAFTSTFVAAIIKGADIQGALLWAPINPMSVVQKIGGQAGLLTHKELEHYLRHAPANYHPVRFK